MDLKKEIRGLVELQKIDSKIYSLSQRKNTEIPENIEKLKNNFEEKKTILISFEEKLKNLQLKRKDKELDLASQEEKILKSQGQLYQLKTNKEYNAKMKEIASLKADISVTEENILKIFEEIDGADKELANAKEKLSIDEKTYRENEAKVKDQLRDIEAEISNFTGKRTILINDISPNVLSAYQRLIESKSGIAIAAADSENCGACYMKVTPQTVNAIKMYKDLVFCEMCQRILYTSQDLS